MIVASACGGGGDSPTPPDGGGNNPPPNVIGPPAKILVSAGDLQVGEPRAALSTNVMIDVRDTANKAVPNVTVSFAIDSGGGSLASTSATTGTDGRAQGGTWTLGPIEGPQVMRVTAGSVSVKVRATARIAPTTIAPITIPVSGGTITINQPGSTLNGTTITVPAGAYATPRTVNISYRPLDGITLPSGATLVSPLLTVKGLEPLAAQNVVVTMPAVVPAGQTPIVVVRDSTTGTTSTANVLKWDASTITFQVRRLNGAAMRPAPADIACSTPDCVGDTTTTTAIRAATIGANATRANRRMSLLRIGALAEEEGPAQVYTITIPDAQIFAPRTTLFTLQKDAWNFTAVPTLYSPDTERGMLVTALHWFQNVGPRVGSLQKNNYVADSRAGEVPLGNRRALRLSAIASKEDVNTPPKTLLPEDRDLPYVWRSIAANMIMTNYQPVPVWLVNVASTNQALVSIRPVLVTSIGDGVMSVYDPRASATQPGYMVFNANHVYTGYVSPDPNDKEVLDAAVPEAAFTFYNRDGMATLFAAMMQPGFGDDRFPATQERMQFDTLGEKNVSWMNDTLTYWMQCAACKGMGQTPTSLLDPTPPNNEVLSSWLWTSANGKKFSAALPNTVDQLKGGFRLTWPGTTTNTLHTVFISMGSCGSGSDRHVCWIDSRLTKVLHATAKIVAVTDPPYKQGIPITFAIATISAPAGATTEWSYDDESAPEDKGTALTTVHKFNAGGTYRVIAKIKHPKTKQIVAVDTLKIDVDGKIWSGWRITSLTLSVDDRFRNRIFPGTSQTYWELFKQNSTNNDLGGPTQRQLIPQIAADSVRLWGIQAGTTPAALIVMLRDTISPVQPGVNLTQGVYIVSGVNVPTPDRTLPQQLDRFVPAMALRVSPYDGHLMTPCDPNFDFHYSQTGSAAGSSASIDGNTWSFLSIQNRIFNDGQPYRVPSVKMTINGDQATGTIAYRYRLALNCNGNDSDTNPWTVTGTFTATRIK